MPKVYNKARSKARARDDMHDALLEMHERCEARGLAFSGELRGIIEAWLAGSTPDGRAERSTGMTHDRYGTMRSGPPPRALDAGGGGRSRPRHPVILRALDMGPGQWMIVDPALFGRCVPMSPEAGDEDGGLRAARSGSEVPTKRISEKVTTLNRRKNEERRWEWRRAAAAESGAEPGDIVIQCASRSPRAAEAEAAPKVRPLARRTVAVLLALLPLAHGCAGAGAALGRVVAAHPKNPDAAAAAWSGGDWDIPARYYARTLEGACE